MAGPLADNPFVVALKALFSPAALVVSAATIVAAVITPLGWHSFPIGIVVWILAVYFSGPHQAKARWKRRLQYEDMLRGLPAHLRPLAKDIDRDVDRIRELVGTDGDGSVLLAGLDVEVEALADAAHRLLASVRSAYSYMRKNSPDELHAREQSLRTRQAALSDEYAREQLEEALQELKRESVTAQEMQVLMERAEASMHNIAASVRSVYSQAVRLSSGSLDEGSAMQQETYERLIEVRSTVAALQEVIDTRIEVVE